MADDSSTSISAKAQPKGVSATASAVYTASAAGLEISSLSGGSSTTHAGAASAVAAVSGSPDLVAFGTGAKKVVLAAIDNGAVKVEAEFEDNKGEVLALAFSPDGALLAAGDVCLALLPRIQADSRPLVGSS